MRHPRRSSKRGGPDPLLRTYAEFRKRIRAGRKAERAMRELGRIIKECQS